MRVIGGDLRGRRFAGPVGKGTRPTADRVREGVASALQARSLFEGSVVLDLYAGTGAMAFEALSRGASAAVLVEKDPREASNIRKNARDLGLEQRVEVLQLDLQRPQKWESQLKLHAPAYDLVFMDPPYAKITESMACLETLCGGCLLAETAVVVLEHAARETPQMQAKLLAVADYRYGDTAVSLWQRVPAEGDATR